MSFVPYRMHGFMGGEGSLTLTIGMRVSPEPKLEKKLGGWEVLWPPTAPANEKCKPE
ncbi:MAG: hypothetical protein ABWK01_06710 [Infirmifilum sp.]